MRPALSPWQRVYRRCHCWHWISPAMDILLRAAAMRIITFLTGLKIWWHFVSSKAGNS